MPLTEENAETGLNPNDAWFAGREFEILNVDDVCVVGPNAGTIGSAWPEDLKALAMGWVKDLVDCGTLWKGLSVWLEVLETAFWNTLMCCAEVFAAF